MSSVLTKCYGGHISKYVVIVCVIIGFILVLLMYRNLRNVKFELESCKTSLSPM